MKESTYQTLLREQYSFNNLRDLIYKAPINGYQDDVTPFGDVTILAKGQLYATSNQDFLFVLDSKNDCTRCKGNWENYNRDRLLALWIIKRIRHRDSQFGFRYELEYKISPRQELEKSDYLDYGASGHVFIVKTDPPLINKRHDYRNVKVTDYNAKGTDNSDIEVTDYRNIKEIDYRNVKRVGYRNLRYRDTGSGLSNDFYKSNHNNRGQYVGLTYLPPVTVGYLKPTPTYHVPKFLAKPDMNTQNYFTSDRSVTRYTPAILTPFPHYTTTYGTRKQYDTGYNYYTKETTPIGITTTGILIPFTITTIKTPTTTTTTSTKVDTTTKQLDKTSTIAVPTEIEIPTTKSTTTIKMETQVNVLTPLDELFGTTTTQSTTKFSTTHPQIPSPTKPTTTTEYIMKPTTEELKTTKQITTIPTTTTIHTTTTIPTTTTIRTTTVPSTITIPSTTSILSKITLPTTTTTVPTTKTRRTFIRTVTPTVTTTTQRETTNATTQKVTLTTQEITTLLKTTNYPTTSAMTLGITEQQTTLTTFPATEEISSTVTTETIPLTKLTTPFTTKASETISDVQQSTSITTNPTTSYATSVETTHLPTTTSTTTIKPKTTKSKPDPFADIFGDELPKSTTKSSTLPTTIGRLVRKKDTEEIFNRNKNKPKIIYTNFYEADIEEVDKNSVTKKRELLRNTEIETSTSQSVFTSISFEVNKHDGKPKKERYVIERPIKATIKQIKNNQHNNNDNIQIFQAEMPEKIQNEMLIDNDSKIMDHLTLSVINHAKSIKLLNKKPKEIRKRKVYGMRMKRIKKKINVTTNSNLKNSNNSNTSKIYGLKSGKTGL